MVVHDSGFKIELRISNFKYLANSFFQFKQFIIHQARCAMKVTTDACLFGAWVAKEIENRKLRIENVLDMGAGTGLLSLMLTQKTGSRIDAIEIDQDSFEQAKENMAASSWSDRLNIFQGDARAFIFPTQYDIIISNPPFYENELDSDDHKRNIALHSHELSFVELLKIIQSNLSPSGTFFLLLAYKRQEEIMKTFQQYKFSLEEIIFVRQSVNHDYFRMMIKGKKGTNESEQTHFDEISIWDEKQQYTLKFIELLKDYYLYL